MDPNMWTTLIGNYGFPIVCCAALFWQNIKEGESHKAEMAGMTEALNNNTLVLTKLLSKIEEGEPIESVN